MFFLKVLVCGRILKKTLIFHVFDDISEILEKFSFECVVSKTCVFFAVFFLNSSHGLSEFEAFEEISRGHFRERRQLSKGTPYGLSEILIILCFGLQS